MNNEQYFKEYKERLRNRMAELGFTNEQFDITYGMMRSCHSTMGATLYAMDDYLDAKGY